MTTAADREGLQKTDRISSLGMWNQAKGFYLASDALVVSEHSYLVDPSYHLISHSIELALKAFLRGYGYSLEQLNKLGHDLNKTLDRAVNSGLGSYFEFSENDRPVLAEMNKYCLSREFEYIESDCKSYPRIDLLISFADRLIRGVSEFCFERRGHHLRSRIARGQV